MAAEVQRRNEYDVTNQINTTDPQLVSEAVCRIYQDLYQQDSARNLPQTFTDLARLYRGEYPSFHECDTDYHDLQHVLDVTLATARLLNGYERGAHRPEQQEREEEDVLHHRRTSSAPAADSIDCTESTLSGEQATATPKRSTLKRGS